MPKWLDRLLQPDEYYTDLLQIDFPSYASQGFGLIMLDIDNTLAPHGSVVADDFARKIVARILDAGLKCWLISNGSRRRIRRYADSLGLPNVPMAVKPLIWGLRRACRRSGTPPRQAILIGDQILTDVISARRAGCRAVLVSPLFQNEGWSVRLKRCLEKKVTRHNHL